MNSMTKPKSQDSLVRIYGLHTPMFLKVVIAAEECGVPYEVCPVDLLKGEHKIPEHLSRHPFGKIPALEYRGEYFFESNSLIRLLGRLSEDKSIYPCDLAENTRVNQWIDYFSLHLGANMTKVWLEKVVHPKYFAQEPDIEVVRELELQILEQLPVVESRLKKQPYLCGDSFSLADINAYCLCFNHGEAGLQLNDFPCFVEYLRKLGEREKFKTVQAKWW